MFSQFLGIDPGKYGAFVILNKDKIITHYSTMPLISQDKGIKAYNLSALAKFFSTLPKDTAVIMEDNNAAPDEGVVSVCTQCGGAGLLRGMIAMAQLPLTDVRPSIWKKDLMKDVPSHKLASLVMAVRILGTQAKDILVQQPNHNIADAMLLAEWGRRQF